MHFVDPVLVRGLDHVKKADWTTRVLRGPRNYTRIHKALKDSKETMKSKSCLTYCAALFVP